MNTRAKKRTDEEWRQIIFEARSSGLSDYEYCRINSMPSSTFYRAIKRLRKRSCDIPAGAVAQDRPQQEVVPINLSDLPLTKPDQMQPVSGVVCDSMFGHLEATMRIHNSHWFSIKDAEPLAHARRYLQREQDISCHGITQT